MDLKGVKAIRAASDATVLSAVESRQDTGAQEHSVAPGRGQGESEGGREERRNGRKNLRKYTPRSAYDGSTARGRRTACAEYKCKRREYAADPLAIPFTFRHSYAPAVTVRPESRGNPPRV